MDEKAMKPRIQISFPFACQRAFCFGKPYQPSEDEFLLDHARSGILLALQALHLPAGSGVGVMVYNCHTVFNAVSQAGCTPVFLDVRDDLTLDLDDLRSKRTRMNALIVSHLFGILNPVSLIREEFPDLVVIEDCAHAYGLKDLTGDVSVFSIGQGKLPSIGDGGILIVGCRAGLKDLRGHAVMLPQPGLLQSLTGTDVCDFTFTSPNEDNDSDTPIWNDILTPLADTLVLDTYRTGYYAGEACLTEHRMGKGRVIHLGSAFSRSRVRHLFEYCSILEPFSEVISAPEGVELVMRRKNGRTFLFVLNFQQTVQTVTLHSPMMLLCSGEPAIGEISLPPFGTAVYETSSQSR